MKRPIARIAYYIAGTFIQILPALYNRFPLVFADLGTYVRSGFLFETPVDRPISYGLMINFFSLNGMFIWGVVIAQALITLWTLQLFCKCFFPLLNPWWQLLVIVPVAVFSSVIWRSSELLPDIYSADALLLMLVLLFRRHLLSRGETMAAFIAFFVLNSVHLSHLIFHVAILGFILALSIIFRRRIAFSVSSFIIILLSSFSLILISGAAMSKSKPIIQMSAMVENRVLYEFMKRECPGHDYSLCPYTDRLTWLSGNQFLWEKDQPVVLTDAWKNHKQEYREIISRILTEQPYRGIFLKNSIRQAWWQFKDFRIGYGNVSYKKGSTPYESMREEMPVQLTRYLQSRQYHDQLDPIFPFWFRIHEVAFYVCLLLVILMALLVRAKRELLFPVIIFLFALIVNAWTVTAFSCINSRYQSRYTWIIVWIAVAMVTEVMIKKFKQAGDK